MIDLILKSEGWVVINIGHPRTGNNTLYMTHFLVTERMPSKNSWKVLVTIGSSGGLNLISG